MKAESLFRTLAVVRQLGRELPLRFVIVGDGDVHLELEKQAHETNVFLGREAVVFTGELVDPRAAYEAADIVVGMGGSALRGMAFGKPLVIVGERGFSAPFNPETAPGFLYEGMYGIGDGDPGNERLASVIRRLAERPDEARQLGEFARTFVVSHFALDVVSTKLAELCQAAAGSPRRFSEAAVEGLRTAGLWTRQGRFLSTEWIIRLKGLSRILGR